MNALVLVAALAAIAVMLLSRAETGRIRLSASTTATQLLLNLDSAEAFASTRLQNAQVDASTIPGGGTAMRSYDLPLENGAVSVSIEDLQGRFNVNWLSLPGNTLAQQAFDRLLANLGVSAEVGTAIREFLHPGGPRDRTSFLALDPPQIPAGGPVLHIDQLFAIPSISGTVRDALSPHLVALPSTTQLNPNTASAAVISAFLPNRNPAQIARLLSQRQTKPYSSPAEFLIAAGVIRAPDRDTAPEDQAGRSPDALSVDMLTVSSDWFALRATTFLRDQHATRSAVFLRQGTPASAQVVWRVTTRP